tara:strand:- start:1456 stop:4806 length:3351 start_codon:yes stop_codon:yes gene_type:complete
MSIFQETFRDFVFRQLKIRENIVKQGNNQGESRFGSPREEVMVSPTAKEKITFPAGAFYTNTVEKQCTIRMSSGVDLREKNEILEEGKYEKSRKNDLINEGLAIRYILEGGTPAKSWDFKSKRNLQEGGKYASVPRGDLRKGGADNPNFGNHYGASYGDPFIRSDAKDGFGIVPMPGIIDANVRTKTAYGSLREAKVNFVCHNRRQLEVLELLYMRPGYPVLLEWGWTPYISNEGKKEEYFPYITEFFKQSSKISTIQRIILNRKKQSGGNYDGFVGYCKNFDIKSRPDGGYDCTTEIIAMGEVLEGLKGKREGNTLVKEGEEYEVDELEYFLNALHSFTGAYYLDANIDSEDYYVEGDRWWKEKLRPILRERHQLFSSFIKLAKFVDNNFIIKEFTEEEIEIIVGAEVMIQSNLSGYSTDNNWRDNSMRRWVEEGSPHLSDKEESLTLQYYNNIDKIKAILDSNIIYKDEETGIDGFGRIEGSKALYSYISWDFLTALLNNFIFPEIKDEGEPIIKITTTYEALGKSAPKPLLYTGNSIPQKFKTFITNHTEPDTDTSWWRAHPDINIETRLNDIADISVDPEVCLFPHQIATYKTGVRQIGLIHFNIDFLLEKYKELRYKGEVLNNDFSLFNWLKLIWEEVNGACVNTHEFVLQTELERPEVIRVIDMISDTKLQPEDLFEIKIQSNESIVRDFNFNTTIPSSLGATVAVAAQAPASINSLESVTFAAFHKNTRFRFNQEDTTSTGITPKQIDTLEKAYDRDYKMFLSSIKKLAEYSRSILGIETSQSPISKGAASNYLESINSKISSLTSRFGEDIKENNKIKYYKGQQKPIKSPPPKSAIIPLKFTAQLDGIGGIVIGNVFKVQKDRLPKGYQGDDIAFVVFGENQKITAGQDWTTDLTGKLILLDIKKKKEETSGSTEETNTSTNTEPTKDPIEPTPSPPPTQQEIAKQQEIFKEYVKLNKQFEVLFTMRKILIDESWGSGTNTFTDQIGDLTNTLHVKVDEWEAFRPQFEEVFGSNAYYDAGTVNPEWGGTDSNGQTEFLVEPGIFYKKFMDEEGNTNTPLQFTLNGQERITYTESPRLNSETVNTYLNTIFTTGVGLPGGLDDNLVEIE